MTTACNTYTATLGAECPSDNRSLSGSFFNAAHQLASSADSKALGFWRVSVSACRVVVPVEQEIFPREANV